MSLKKLLKENADNPRARVAEDLFWKMFQVYRLKITDKLLPRQIQELSTLTETEQDECIDIMAEKLMAVDKIVPPSWRYMVFCKNCKDFRPMPKKFLEVLECPWCNFLRVKK